MTLDKIQNVEKINVGIDIGSTTTTGTWSFEKFSREKCGSNLYAFDHDGSI